MLTPQEVSEHAFAKAGFGGYNMAMVDEFLDQLTEDYTTLYKENAALKSKMKVLVDKVEEYRSTEDAMRKTLLTAQKMADDMVKEAEEKRASLVSHAEEEARKRVSGLRQEVEAEQYDTMDNLTALLADDRYAIARMSVFCDSYFVRAYPDAALRVESGSFWYDAASMAWLDPSHPQTLVYITSLCQEYAQLGFDEILLTDCGFPTQLSHHRAAGVHRRLGRHGSGAGADGLHQESAGQPAGRRKGQYRAAQPAVGGIWLVAGNAGSEL